MRTKIMKDAKGNELLIGDYVKAGKLSPETGAREVAVIGRETSLNFKEQTVQVAWPQIPAGVLQRDTFAVGFCELVLQVDGMEPGAVAEGTQIDGQGLEPIKTKK